MAKIPTAEALDQPNVSAVPVTTRVPSYDDSAFTASNRVDAQNAKALGNLGDGVEDFGLALQKRQDEEDEYEMQKRFVDFDVQQEKRLIDMQNNPGKEAKGFTSSFVDGYNRDGREFFKSVPSRLKAKYDEALVRRRGGYESRAYRYEIGERDRQHREDLDTKLLDLRNVTAVNPDAYRENVARGVSIISASRLPPADKDKAMKSFAQGVEEDAVRARIDRGDDISQIIRDLKARPGTVAPEKAEVEGLLVPGNIDLAARKIVHNPDGSISTLKSMSFKDGKTEVLIPTLDPQGQPLSDEQAIALYKATGQHLGQFKDADTATRFAKQLSEDMEAAALGEPSEADKVVYRHLKPDQRLRLINVARVAGRGEAVSRIEDDIEKIRDGIDVDIVDGKTSLERGGEFLTDMQRERYSRRWNAAIIENAAKAPLANMSNDEGDEHLGNILDKAEQSSEEGYKLTQDALRAANPYWEKIKKLRDDDPARAVFGSPEVQAAVQTAKAKRLAPNMSGGGVGTAIDAGWAVPPQQAQELVIAARLAAQKRLGIRLMAITKREAVALMNMPPDDGKMTDREFADHLKAAEQRALEIYGPKYAGLAFEAGVSTLAKQDRRDTGYGIARKIIAGEPIGEFDLTQLRAMARVSGGDRLFYPVEAPEIARGGMRDLPEMPALPAPGFNDAKRGASPPGFSPATAYPEPTPEDIERLRQKPSRYQEFERTYGPGAAARALSTKPASTQSASQSKSKSAKDR